VVQFFCPKAGNETLVWLVGLAQLSVMVVITEEWVSAVWYSTCSEKRVSSPVSEVGHTFRIMAVLELPPNES
jgi:hypothetical protein